MENINHEKPMGLSKIDYLDLSLKSLFQGDALKRTGQKVTPERQILHDLHRQHLMAVLKNNTESHYEEIISLLIVLTDAEVLDPTGLLRIVQKDLIS